MIRFLIRQQEWLDPFSAHQVTCWEKTFPTVEHGYQWRKASLGNDPGATQILTAASPWRAKELGQLVRKPANWNAVKYDVMRELYRAKIDAHPEIREYLLATGSSPLVEASPDEEWGEGTNAEGKNMIGILWMELRQELQSANR